MTRPLMLWQCICLSLFLLPYLAAAARLPDPSPAQPWSLAGNLQRYLGQSIFSILAPAEQPRYQTFGLRQAYHQGMADYPDLRAVASYDYKVHALSANADPSSIDYIPPIKTKKQIVTRAKDINKYLQVRGQSHEGAMCASATELDWEDIEIDAPDTSDRQTVLAFAKMSAQAYQNSTVSWDGFGSYNLSTSFGWETDGLRGHIFTTPDNGTIVVALKGTSAAFLPGGGETARRDKANDNLLFSCCCARVSWSWSTVCDCYAGHGSQCGQTCLERALVEKSLYYPATTDLFNNISYMYPDSQIWITGHSLGGALSSLLGMTFGAPTVTFEAPGERMAAMRLHLPLPPSRHPEDSPVSALPITHVYHTADPIAMGECNGAGSLCSNFGYAMESRCHAGKSIVYDTVGKLGWSSSVNTHRINSLIDDVLSEDWDKKVKKAKGISSERWRWPWKGGDGEEDDEEQDNLKPVPPRRSEDKCRDCADWRFVDTEGEEVL